LTDCGYVAATAELDCPLVLQSWAFDVYWERLNLPGAQARIEAALAHCQTLFADCNAVVTECRRIAGRKFDAELIMPWGLDLELAGLGGDRSRHRREMGWGDELVLVCTRNLEPLYRHDVILSSFEQALKSGLELRLVLTADGSLKGQLSEWITRRRLAHRISILGGVSHENVLSHLGAADGYISAAESDGVSISLLEALYHGAVPIVSDVGGNPEWVKDHANGFLARVGSVSEFADAINAFANIENGQRRKIAEANRNLVVQRANWRNNFVHFEEKLRTLAGHRHVSVV